MEPQLSSRRAALQRILAGGLLACLPGRSARPQEPGESRFAFRYALASSLYGKMPLAEILPEVAATGCEAIDLWPLRHGNQREQVDEMGIDAFKELLAKHSVSLGMTTRYDLGPFQLKEEVQFLKQFSGGRLIVTGAPRLERDSPLRAGGAALREAVREFVERMQPDVELAAEAGISIAIENHANALLETGEAMRYFAEFARNPHLGVALAPYHLPQDPEQIAGLMRDLGPKLIHFYAWEHGTGSRHEQPKEDELKQLPGRGPLDFRPLVSALREIQFSGWTQVFMHPFPRGVPILDEMGAIREVLNASRKYLDGLAG